MSLSYADTLSQVPQPERRSIVEAHQLLHECGSSLLDNDTYLLKHIGKTLLRSPDPDHQIAAGWALVAPHMHEGAITKQARQDIDKASICFSAIKKYTPKNRTYFQAVLGSIYANELTRSKRPVAESTDNILSRLQNLNGTLVERHKNASNLGGFAFELAGLMLLLKAGKDNGAIAVPSYPWQDRHLRVPSNSKNINHDIVYLEDGAKAVKIQVKSSLFQTEDGVTPANNIDEPIEFWRDIYDDSIAIIFGDVHLHSNPQKIQISRALHSVYAPSQNEKLIKLATGNILAEIDEHRRNIQQVIDLR